MKIVRLRCFMSRDGNRPRVLVALDTDENLTGWGECYNHGPDRALKPILEYLFSQIQNEDPRQIERIMLKLYQHARFPPGSLSLAAMSAIDHALWDISAKALNVPVYMLLGGNVRDKVRVYLGLYTAPDANEVKEQVDAASEQYGLNAFKMSPYRTDIHAVPWGETLAATTEWANEVHSLCPGFEFAYDAHARLFEPWQARDLGNALAHLNPLFYEEPMRPENIELWGDLKSQLKVPLATGESLYSKFEFARLINARGADIIQPDICVVGGVTEMRKIATIAETYYLNVAPHNPMGPLATAINFHFCMALTNFKILEYRLPGSNAFLGLTSPTNENTSSYVRDPYIPKSGYLHPRPEKAGWGVEIDEDYLQTDQYVHWERKLPMRPDGSTGYT